MCIRDRYEKTIQSAFREAADALAVRATVGDQLEAPVSYTHLDVYKRQAILTLAACGKSATAPSGMPPGASAPPEVGIITVEPRTVAITSELSGRTVPNVIAEIRPQIGGIIQSRPFHEGGEVKAGELLYQIDPAVFQANYESAKANLARAEANLVTVRLKADRYKELLSAKAVSQQAFDDANACLLYTSRCV